MNNQSQKNEKPIDLLDDSEESSTFLQQICNDLPGTIPKDRVQAINKRFGEKLRIAINLSDNSPQGGKIHNSGQDRQANKSGGYTVFLEGQTVINYQPKNATDDDNNNFDERLSARMFLNTVSPNSSQDNSQIDAQTTFTKSSNQEINKQRENHTFSIAKLIKKVKF